MKILKNKKLIIILVVLLLAAAAVTALVLHHVQNGWKEKDGQRYYKVKGKNLTGLNEVDGKTYIFAK